MGLILFKNLETSFRNFLEKWPKLGSIVVIAIALVSIIAGISLVFFVLSIIGSINNFSMIILQNVIF